MLDNKKIVAVTGSSGYIGSRLLRYLEECGEYGLVAFDINPPAVPIHDIEVYRLDINRDISSHLRRSMVNTVVHLAENNYLNRNARQGIDSQEQRIKNLQAVLGSSVETGVAHIIYISSHTVYGSKPNLEIPITEISPLADDKEFTHSFDNVVIEDILSTFSVEHPDCLVTILRCTPVLGPTANDNLFSIFNCTHPIGVMGYNPPFQFLHEDDLARILEMVIRNSLAGVFNVASDGVVFWREILNLLPFKPLTVPNILVVPLVLLSKVGFPTKAATSRSAFNLMKHPLLLGTGLLKQEINYTPSYTSLETFTSFANSVLWNSY
ncbi:MAG: hypothetical protein CL886_07835 [Dehalococcoidia bacterium]|nr:hypothetical protein [Dehalococcoidia bacterium]|tara:strand:- start:588 stop:1556 length:969 start_codon:yes stop_codon:yes gene_type:complete